MLLNKSIATALSVSSFMIMTAAWEIRLYSDRYCQDLRVDDEANSFTFGCITVGGQSWSGLDDAECTYQTFSGTNCEGSSSPIDNGRGFDHCATITYGSVSIDCDPCFSCIK